MKQNPFSIIFGRIPGQLVSRTAQMEEVVSSFRAEEPSSMVYMITGVRGSGKTVFMNEVAETLRPLDDWICISLNPETDLLQNMASKLCSEDVLAKIFQRARINLSLFGLGLEVRDAAPVANLETAIEKMTETLMHHGKKILITIDEVSSTPEMRKFAGEYQVLIGRGMPVYLLMTGLFENINRLQNEKTLTFLYRAPKLWLKPLNVGIMTEKYMKIFGISEDHALQMARLTNGYPYAFQVLGYFTWKHDGDDAAAHSEYQLYLDEYVYDKIWSELSAKDQKILYGLAVNKSRRVGDVISELGMKENEINQYRTRLIRKGILNGDTRGILQFNLPGFDRYVREHFIP